MIVVATLLAMRLLNLRMVVIVFSYATLAVLQLELRYYLVISPTTRQSM